MNHVVLIIIVEVPALLVDPLERETVNDRVGHPHSELGHGIMVLMKLRSLLLLDETHFTGAIDGFYHNL